MSTPENNNRPAPATATPGAAPPEVMPVIRPPLGWNVPEYLRRFDTQWLLWKWGRRREGDKVTKIPVRIAYDPARRTEEGALIPAYPNFRPSEPTSGTYFEDALGTADLVRRGLGFIPGPDDDLGFGDLDKCLTGPAADPARPLTLDTPGIAPHALDILRRFPTYWERTPSCRGLRWWFRIFGKPLKGLLKVEPFGLEVYFAYHFSTVTGDHVAGTPGDVLDCSDAARQLLAEHFPKAHRSRVEELTATEAMQKAAREAREERERRRLERGEGYEGRGDLPGGRRGRIVERARRYVGKIAGAVSGRGGHKKTFHVACILIRDFMLDRGEAAEVLGEWNRTCVPPWSVGELNHKLDGAENATGPMGRLLEGRSAVRHDEYDDDIEVEITFVSSSPPTTPPAEAEPFVGPPWPPSGPPWPPAGSTVGGRVVESSDEHGYTLGDDADFVGPPAPLFIDFMPGGKYAPPPDLPLQPGDWRVRGLELCPNPKAMLAAPLAPGMPWRTIRVPCNRADCPGCGARIKAEWKDSMRPCLERDEEDGFFADNPNAARVVIDAGPTWDRHSQLPTYLAHRYRAVEHTDANGRPAVTVFALVADVAQVRAPWEARVVGSQAQFLAEYDTAIDSSMRGKGVVHGGKLWPKAEGESRPKEKRFKVIGGLPPDHREHIAVFERRAKCTAVELAVPAKDRKRVQGYCEFRGLNGPRAPKVEQYLLCVLSTGWDISFDDWLDMTEQGVEVEVGSAGGPRGAAAEPRGGWRRPDYDDDG
jgi:hypothetical protein